MWEISRIDDIHIFNSKFSKSVQIKINPHLSTLIVV